MKKILLFVSMFAVAFMAAFSFADTIAKMVKPDSVKLEGAITYTFKVDEHVIAEITSEVQEHTHDMYLAHCVRGANDCYIEVPVNDTRTELQLYYTGYIIKYTITRGIGSTKVSNNGWAIYEF